MSAKHNATVRGFLTRRPGDSPTFAWSLPSGSPLPQPNIATAETVTLKIADERVIVRAPRIMPSGSYVGLIDGFEPSKVLEIDGMKIGGEIEFDDEHVFGATD